MFETRNNIASRRESRANKTKARCYICCCVVGIIQSSSTSLVLPRFSSWQWICGTEDKNIYETTVDKINNIQYNNMRKYQLRKIKPAQN